MFNCKTNANSNIIFVDIDDTLCNTREAIYKIYQETTGDLSTTPYTKDKRHESFCPMWTGDEVEKLFMYGKKLYETALPFPDAVQAMDTLAKKGYDIRVVTLQHPEGMSYKQEWINKYFPSLSNKVYVYTNVEGNKDVFCGHAIIDDHWKNIETNGSKYSVLYDYYNIYDKIKYPFKYRTLKDMVDNF